MQLHRQQDLITRHGATIAPIGNGAINFIEGFRERTGWQGPIYTDPSRKVYEAAELKRGVMSTLGPKSLARSVGALARGFRQSSMQGDAWQQGGVLIVSRQGEVIWHHASDGAGDNASPTEIEAALRQATTVRG